MQIKSIITVQCFACTKAKIKRQIRRTPRIDDPGPVERLTIDFYTYKEESLTWRRVRSLLSIDTLDSCLTSTSASKSIDWERLLLLSLMLLFAF